MNTTRTDDQTPNESQSVDELFLTAEKLSQDFSLFPEDTSLSINDHIKGLITEDAIEEQAKKLKELDVDSYVRFAIDPTEAKSRPGAKAILKKMGCKIIREVEKGPLYAAEVEMDFGGRFRRIGFLTQDRASNNGVWMPEHHLAAVDVIRGFAQMSLPVVTFMDTPGADAGEAANEANQAHSISRLIAEMSNIHVPTVGIIIGLGFSGGAIPLATTNVLLSVRDGVFNTIQPKGLAGIARQYNLSWQECAQYVGVSSYELYQQGNIDGIIDFVPGERVDMLQNLNQAIVSSITAIEESVQDFVTKNTYMIDHYRRSLDRYLHLARQPKQNIGLSMANSPTEYLNVFGLSYRYLRYLGLRKRIKSTTTENYGRLSELEIPKGDLDQRTREDREKAFQSWFEDSDKLVYNDDLIKAWKNYKEKKASVFDERGRIAQFFLGEPKKKFEDARRELHFTVGLFLYNRWKADADDNFLALAQHLKQLNFERLLLQAKDIADGVELLKAIADSNDPISEYLRENFSGAGKQLIEDHRQSVVAVDRITPTIVAELNSIIAKTPLDRRVDISGLELPKELEAMTQMKHGRSKLLINRRMLEAVYGSKLNQFIMNDQLKPNRDLTILDIMALDELRDGFIGDCQNMLIFGNLYDKIVNNLVSIAREANTFKTLSQRSVQELLEPSLATASKFVVEKRFSKSVADSEEVARKEHNQSERFYEWLNYFIASNKRGQFLELAEEWKKVEFPRLSDTLLVIITFFFEKLLPEYYNAQRSDKNYEGRINPIRIGRRKDFWNRLSIAYQDLLIQDVLTKEKRKKASTPAAFIDRFLEDFEEIGANLMSSDPVAFPGFRLSIEKALQNDIQPCGVITGIGTLKDGDEKSRVGVLVSNVLFQAGAFDMAGAEKFCKLLVECAKQKLPIICFVSSGGMQTKEGAAALFSMSIVNDRITRFVRDNDLPIIAFGFNDCTGGSQASFVTHPLVQTYYFSGADIPFAGRVVVPSYLPSTATLANYLSQVPGAMQGLVKHPFAEGLDTALREIDPNIPLPQETVIDVFNRIIQGHSETRVETTPEESQSGQEIPEATDLIAPVKKVLIHARGCTAVKLIRGAQARNINIVLVQSDPDMNSVPVDMLGENDRVVCIGGNTPDESYLNALSVINVADYEEVDSLHPGIGFLSENDRFASLVRKHNINFIGPPVSSMETMGNKSNAINTSLRLGVPVVPGSHGILTSSEATAAVAENIGYPVLIKAVHGGGGKGIQVVERPEDIHELFHQVSAEAKSAFGNGDIYLEKYVTSLRHIEVQILRDTHGNTKILGLRDCSVQRNNQKIFEESGSTMLPQDFEQAVYKYAEDLANEVDYLGAGTVEFIFDLKSNAVYFMEMNTRLQVEHPVTELVTNNDIVGEQFRIASGESIEDLSVEQNGYAIEVRINAEKITKDSKGNINFVPTPGDIIECQMPEVDHITLISMAGEGKSVSPFYDSMISQIICYGKDRLDTIDKLLAYLDTVVIKGVCTNIALAKRILKDDTFRNGEYDTTYLPKLLDRINIEELIEEIQTAADMQGNVISLEALAIEGSDEIKVISPSTGIFYITPSPSEPAYVKVGDRISTDKTLCQLEAMKLFSPLALRSFNSGDNEVYPSDQMFEIVRINNNNGTQVNQGDLLFVVRPVKESAVA